MSARWAVKRIAVPGCFVSYLPFQLFQANCSTPTSANALSSNILALLSPVYTPGPGGLFVGGGFFSKPGYEYSSYAR
mgnify:CR=1 FL=1